MKRTSLFDLFCLGKKFLVFNLVARNLKIKYRRSVFGVLWTLLNPLALTAIYYFVFKVILSIQIPHYLVFMLSGVLPWSFFAQTVLEGMESIVGNWALISKVPIPIQVFPWVGALTNLVTLLLALPIVLLAAVFSGVAIGPSILLLAFYFLALYVMAYSFALIFGIGYAYFRDLKHLVGIVLQLWFYGTPVIYDAGMIPPKYGWVLLANPLGFVFSGIHRVLIQGDWPPSSELAVVSAWTAAALGLAIAIHSGLSREVVERV